MTDAQRHELPAWRTDLDAIVRWASLGLVAGGLSGLLVGGVAGRLAMFLLRLTSSDSVHGVESDHGFTIGIISTGTLFLLFITTALGAAGGLAYVAVRSFLPVAIRLVGWAALGGLFLGAAIVEPDGADFTRLEPRALAVILFVLIPSAGALVMAMLVERWGAGWWWRSPGRTVAFALPTIPGVVLVPTAVLGAIGVVVTFAAGRISPLRRLAATVGARVVVMAVLTLVGVMSLVALVGDIGQVFD